MPIIYTFPSSHYNVMPFGAPLDDIEIKEISPPAKNGTDSTAELKLNVKSQVFTNVQVSITPSRQTLKPPHSVTPSTDWTIDAGTPPTVVFKRLQVPKNSLDISFKVKFTGGTPINAVFIYRIQCDQLSEPVEQYITVPIQA